MREITSTSGSGPHRWSIKTLVGVLLVCHDTLIVAVHRQDAKAVNPYGIYKLTRHPDGSALQRSEGLDDAAELIALVVVRPPGTTGFLVVFRYSLRISPRK